MTATKLRCVSGPRKHQDGWNMGPRCVGLRGEWPAVNARNHSPRPRIAEARLQIRSGGLRRPPDEASATAGHVRIHGGTRWCRPVAIESLTRGKGPYVTSARKTPAGVVHPTLAARGCGGPPRQPVPAARGCVVGPQRWGGEVGWRVKLRARRSPSTTQPPLPRFVPMVIGELRVEIAGPARAATRARPLGWRVGVSLHLPV